MRLLISPRMASTQDRKTAPVLKCLYIPTTVKGRGEWQVREREKAKKGTRKPRTGRRIPTVLRVGNLVDEVLTKLLQFLFQSEYKPEEKRPKKENIQHVLTKTILRLWTSFSSSNLPLSAFSFLLDASLSTWICFNCVVISAWAFRLSSYHACTPHEEISHIPYTSKYIYVYVEVLGKQKKSCYLFLSLQYK